MYGKKRKNPSEIPDGSWARREIAAQRASRAVWLDRIRDMVRSQPGGDITFDEAAGELELFEPSA
jgi:hypothetical protein